jgi:hypothetical protein
MKLNYAAWHVSPNGFNAADTDIEKLHYFAKYAVLSPSGHNTRFADDGQTLILKADFSRRLPYSGIKANEPYVSLGACLGTLELAAEGFGYKLDIRYLLHDESIAAIRLGSKTKADPSLLEAIINRVSNRSFYAVKSLPKTILDKLELNYFETVGTKILEDKDDITYIADQTTLATYATMGDKEFRAELSKWVRNNITKQHDGMPGFVQGIPTPPSLLAKHIIKRIDVSKDQAKKDSTRVLNSGSLIIVSTKISGNRALLDAGNLYARICILAQKQGVASAGVGAAVIDAGTRQSVIDHFGIKGKPIAIIRLGMAEKPARHTPRWTLEQILNK